MTVRSVGRGIVQAQKSQNNGFGESDVLDLSLLFNSI